MISTPRMIVSLDTTQKAYRKIFSTGIAQTGDKSNFSHYCNDNEEDLQNANWSLHAAIAWSLAAAPLRHLKIRLKYVFFGWRRGYGHSTPFE